MPLYLAAPPFFITKNLHMYTNNIIGNEVEPVMKYARCFPAKSLKLTCMSHQKFIFSFLIQF